MPIAQGITWKIEDFRNLYQARFGDGQLPKLEVYFQTLNWKFVSAHFHALKSEEIYNAIFDSGVVRFSDGKVQKALDETVFETEAMIQVLHSMGDIMGQILNLAVLGANAFPDDSMGLLFKVSDRISSRNLAPNISNALNVLKDSQEFKYMKAFCNTIKHNTILDFDYRMHFDFRDKNNSQQGLRFKQFVYKGDTYPVTWVHVVRDEYSLKLFNVIFSVGNSINDFLR